LSVFSSFFFWGGASLCVCVSAIYLSLPAPSLSHPSSRVSSLLSSIQQVGLQGRGTRQRLWVPEEPARLWQFEPALGRGPHPRHSVVEQPVPGEVPAGLQPVAQLHRRVAGRGPREAEHRGNCRRGTLFTSCAHAHLSVALSMLMCILLVAVLESFASRWLSKFPSYFMNSLLREKCLSCVSRKHRLQFMLPLFLSRA